MTTSGSDDVPPRRHGSQVHAVRAAIVVGCFLVAVIVLLGPASRLTAIAPTTSTTTTTTAPAKPVVKHSTSVQVANGTTSPHLATHYTQVLQVQGWDVQPPLDSTTSPSHSIVYFAPGQQAAAKLVAEELGLNPKSAVKPRTGDTGATDAATMDVIVILGPDLAT